MTKIEPVERVLARILLNAKTTDDIEQAVGADRAKEAIFKIRMLIHTGVVECRTFGALLPPTFRIARTANGATPDLAIDDDEIDEIDRCPTCCRKPCACEPLHFA